MIVTGKEKTDGNVPGPMVTGPIFHAQSRAKQSAQPADDPCDFRRLAKTKKTAATRRCRQRPGNFLVRLEVPKHKAATQNPHSAE